MNGTSRPDNSLTHFDPSGQAQMVDVSGKPSTQRVAVAEGWLTMNEPTFSLIQSGKNSKGDVLGVARIAAIQGAKRTSELIPLCHPILISKISIEFLDTADPWAIGCRAKVQCLGPTGVEMEALTSVTIALLTIYDMCKAVDRGMSLGPIHLLEKSGGRSGHFQR